MNVHLINIDIYDPKIPNVSIGTKGSYNSEAVDFDLGDTAWAGLTLLVSFLPAGTTGGVSVFYTGSPVLVPNEVMGVAGWHKMTLTGSRGDRIINSKVVRLYVSSDTLTPCITPDPEPTPTTYQQVVDMMDKQAHDAADAEAAQLAAETAQGLAEGARDEAQAAKDAAELSANSANQAATAALGYKNSAESAMDAANLSAESASQSAQAANDAKHAAEIASENAEEWAGDIHGAKEAAELARDESVSAKNISVSAKEEAVSANNAAQSAAMSASGSATSAGASAISAAQSAGNAEIFKNQAGASANAASVSEGNASASAASALDDKNAAESAKVAAEAAQEAAELAQGLAETARDEAEAAVYKNTRHYTVRWNKTDASMTRLNDAAKITTNTTNFTHNGSVNPNYNNPFDDIYPWSGIKLCNIDIERYAALLPGQSLRDCVKAWEGDTDFSYADVNGVWDYTPEFYGKSWDDGTYRYFDVSDKAVGGHVHYPESIEGRWHGRSVTLTVGDAPKTCLVPSIGMPAKNTAMSTLHTYAKNYGATLDSIFSIDASTLLLIVEFATMNTQDAIGNGVSNMYRQSSDFIQAEATASTIVKVLKSAGLAFCLPGAIFDIGTSDGGRQVGSYLIVSVEEDGEDSSILNVTLDEPVTVTTAHYWSVHGIANAADEQIGSKSGYIGTNGKCNAYYRGKVLFGNMFFYILGVYRQAGTQRVFIANNEAEADAVDALNAEVHYDTGITLSQATGYVGELGMLSRSGLLAIPPFCTAIGGTSASPVGDYHYITPEANNTVLLRGGRANTGSSVGAFYGTWAYSASYSYWSYSARPRLKSP